MISHMNNYGGYTFCPELQRVTKSQPPTLNHVVIDSQCFHKGQCLEPVSILVVCETGYEIWRPEKQTSMLEVWLYACHNFHYAIPSNTALIPNRPHLGSPAPDKAPLGLHYLRFYAYQKTNRASHLNFALVHIVCALCPHNLKLLYVL